MSSDLLLALAEHFEALAIGTVHDLGKRRLLTTVLEAIRLRKDPWEHTSALLKGVDRKQVSDALFYLFEYGEITYNREHGYALVPKSQQPKLSPESIRPIERDVAKQDRIALQNQRLWDAILNAKKPQR